MCLHTKQVPRLQSSWSKSSDVHTTGHKGLLEREEFVVVSIGKVIGTHRRTHEDVLEVLHVFHVGQETAFRIAAVFRYEEEVENKRDGNISRKVQSEKMQKRIMRP